MCLLTAASARAYRTGYAQDSGGVTLWGPALVRLAGQLVDRWGV
jgi:hypothetical protein